MGDRVFLKVRGNKSSLSIGNCKKLEARLCGAFEVLSRVGLVAYELGLPPVNKVHNVFHILLLKNYVYDPNDILDWSLLQVEPGGENCV